MADPVDIFPLLKYFQPQGALADFETAANAKMWGGSYPPPPQRMPVPVPRPQGPAPSLFPPNQFVPGPGVVNAPVISRPPWLGQEVAQAPTTEVSATNNDLQPGPAPNFNKPPPVVLPDEQKQMDPRRNIKQRTDAGFGQNAPTDPISQMSNAQQEQQQGSDAWKWGLLAAGLGILSNNKGNYGAAGPAIGAGGLMGLNTFLGQRQQEQNNSFREQQQKQNKEYQDAQTKYLNEKAQIERDKMEKARYQYKVLPDGSIAALNDGKMEKIATTPEDIGAMALELASTDAEKAYAKAKPFDFIKFKGEEQARKERAAAGADNISVGVEAYEKRSGTLMADEMARMQTAGAASIREVAKYKRLGDLLGQVNTGKFTGTTTEFKSAAKAIGINLDAMGIKDDVAPAQAARALSRELALEMRNPQGGAGMPGALSDRDRDFLESMIPGLESDPNAWPQMIEAYTRMKKRDAEVAKLARQYAANNGGQLDYGFYDTLEEWSAANPLFGDMPTGKKPSGPKDPWE